jgi:hypothetical protein
MLIIILGAFMLLAGVFIIAKPEALFKVLRDNADSLWLYIGAVVVRFLLGTLLVSRAEVSKYPAVVETMGWIAIFAAVAFLLMGRKNFIRLVTWAFSFVKPLGRIGGFLALSFGFFLIDAFV